LFSPLIMFSRMSARLATAARRVPTARLFTTAAVISPRIFTRATTAAICVAAATTATLGVAAATTATATADALPLEGRPGTNFERTFIAIKPDGVQRGLIAKIIARFEEKGFKLVALKLITPTPDLAAGHYDDLKNKPFFPSLTKFFSSGPIIAMVWEGKGAIRTGRVLLGETDPAKSLPGSIRGDYSIDIGRNIIHGSDSAEGAQHEINFWFKRQEVYDWNATAAQHIYEKP